MRRNGIDREANLSRLFATLHEAGKFNGSVLVADENAVIYEGIWGVADRATGRPITAETMFNSASVSKTFTSAAVLLLKERGLLTLDDDIGRWFPELPYRGVTVRHLLGHTSGIPNYIRPVRTGLLDGCWSREKRATNREMVERIVGLYPQAEFAPGDRNEYSNTAYLLLASLTERTADCTWADYLEANLFKPLGLNRTAENHDAERAAKLPDYAVGYYREEDGRYVPPHRLPDMEFCFYLDELQGDGNVHTTTRDLLRWDRALRSGELLPASALEEAYTPVVTRLEGVAGNGLGWFVREVPSRGRLVEHSGYWPGYSAEFRRYLDGGLTIVLLCNEEYEGSYKERERFMAEIESIAFGEA